MVDMNREKSGPSWRAIIQKYNKPSVIRSVWQLISSLVLYALLWYAMLLSLEISFGLTLAISLIAGGILTRIFIIFHDCGHGSFFHSKKWNAIIGNLTGILTFTPYVRWTDSHRTHHFTVGNLDKRGIGDVWTLTTDEYQALPAGKKIQYRLFRHPLIMLGLGGFLVFIVGNRFTTRIMNKQQKLNIFFTNICVGLMAVGLSLLLGWKEYLLVQIPTFYFASILGVYLFYLQHQFEGVHWYRQEEWDYETVALEGSSYFKLPTILRWFTGNIGFHHIHHLGPSIPNYYLKKCYSENPLFQTIKPITLWSSFRCLRLRFWDEKIKRIVGFRELRARP